MAFSPAVLPAEEEEVDDEELLPQQTLASEEEKQGSASSDAGSSVSTPKVSEYISRVTLDLSPSLESDRSATEDVLYTGLGSIPSNASMASVTNSSSTPSTTRVIDSPAFGLFDAAKRLSLSQQRGSLSKSISTGSTSSVTRRTRRAATGATLRHTARHQRHRSRKHAQIAAVHRSSLASQRQSVTSMNNTPMAQHTRPVSTRSKVREMSMHMEYLFMRGTSMVFGPDVLNQPSNSEQESEFLSSEFSDEDLKDFAVERMNELDEYCAERYIEEDECVRVKELSRHCYQPLGWILGLGHTLCAVGLLTAYLLSTEDPHSLFQFGKFTGYLGRKITHWTSTIVGGIYSWFGDGSNPMIPRIQLSSAADSTIMAESPSSLPSVTSQSSVSSSPLSSSNPPSASEMADMLAVSMMDMSMNPSYPLSKWDELKEIRRGLIVGSVALGMMTGLNHELHWIHFFKLESYADRFPKMRILQMCHGLLAPSVIGLVEFHLGSQYSFLAVYAAISNFISAKLLNNFALNYVGSALSESNAILYGLIDDPQVFDQSFIDPRLLELTLNGGDFDQMNPLEQITEERDDLVSSDPKSMRNVVQFANVDSVDST